MERQSSIGLIEILLKAINSDLKHFKFFSAFVLLPTLAVFIAVMWVIKPMYAAVAIVTPPPAGQASLGSLGSMLGGMSGMSSLLGLTGGDEDANAVYTIFNSWELHDKVIREFNLEEHYEFDGHFHADLLKMFRKRFGIELNKDDMFAISMEDEDYKLAAKMVWFMLEKADSAFNAFKTAQAKQSREYFQSRLDSCEHVLDSLLEDFVKFQVDNDFYDPEIQLESTLKYMSALQAKREEVAIELAFEKADRGTGSKRYDELSKRYSSVNSSLHGALNGKNRNLGMVALKKSPGLGLEYMRRENEIRIQEAMYKLLRQQSEQMRLEEAKMLKNLHILEAPWENDKKIYPLRGVTLVFTFSVAVLLGTILCCLFDYFEEEERKGSDVAREWKTIKGFFRRKSKG